MSDNEFAILRDKVEKLSTAPILLTTSRQQMYMN